MRKCGILMPITSLPSKYGIGCFSKSAYEFVDFLVASGQKYWQILPLGPTGFGDSPYQSFSTFAGNPYLISLENLISEGVISQEECDETDFGDNPSKIDYGKLFENRYKILQRAFKNTDTKKDSEYITFVNEHNWWLESYTLFMALKKHFGNISCRNFPDDIKKRNFESLNHYRKTLSKDIEFQYYLQYTFFSQWNKLKKYANNKGIKIIGDLPIYVSQDSSDLWANPQLFMLDENLNPGSVAGCPPDGFSKSGQLWGNPLYDWEIHKNTGYDWWIKRLEHNFSLYDVIRIDHFRGFDEYYSIPATDSDAVNGEWKKGPGYDFFSAVKKAFKDKHFIAEDLGFVTKSVKDLLSFSGFPGMKVLEFAFDSRDTGTKNDYLPHSYSKNCVAYTGTHDNQTLVSWFEDLSHQEKNTVREYLCDKYTPDSQLYKSLIALIMRSNADLCIIPIQDYLGLNDHARINHPSTTGNNWQWRILKKELTPALQKEIYNFANLYGRLNKEVDYEK